MPYAPGDRCRRDLTTCRTRGPDRSRSAPATPSASHRHHRRPVLRRADQRRRGPCAGGGAQRRVRQHRLRPVRERRQVERMAMQQVRALLLAPVTGDHGYLLPYRPLFPTVLVDRTIAGGDYDTVLVDDHGATKHAVEHLLATGTAGSPSSARTPRSPPRPSDSPAPARRLRLPGSSPGPVGPARSRRGRCRRGGDPGAAARARAMTRSRRRWQPTRAPAWGWCMPCTASSAPGWRWSASATSTSPGRCDPG